MYSEQNQRGRTYFGFSVRQQDTKETMREHIIPRNCQMWFTTRQAGVDTHSVVINCPHFAVSLAGRKVPGFVVC